MWRKDEPSVQILSAPAAIHAEGGFSGSDFGAQTDPDVLRRTGRMLHLVSVGTARDRKALGGLNVPQSRLKGVLLAPEGARMPRRGVASTALNLLAPVAEEGMAAEKIWVDEEIQDHLPELPPSFPEYMEEQKVPPSMVDKSVGIRPDLVEPSRPVKRAFQQPPPLVVAEQKDFPYYRAQPTMSDKGPVGWEGIHHEWPTEDEFAHSQLTAAYIKEQEEMMTKNLEDFIKKSSDQNSGQK